MTLQDKPAFLSMSGNLRKFRINSDIKILFLLKEGEKVLVEQTYDPDKDGMVIIDVTDIVESRLFFRLSDIDTVYTQPELVKTFTAIINESEFSFRVIRSGVDQFQDSPINFLTQNFLTWQPQQKKVTYYTPEFLTYYAVQDSVVRIKMYFSQSKDEPIKYSYAELKEGNAYTIPLQYAILARLAANKQLAFYDVWIEDQAGNMLTYIQRYVPTSIFSEDEQWILFENSLGGIDTFRAYGSTDFTADHVHNIAEVDEISLEYRIDTQRKFKKNTGYLDKYERQWLLDFFPAKTKYIYFDSFIRSIVVIESDVNYKSGELPSNYTFTYKYADAHPFLNLPRTDTFPSDLTMEIPDLGSFTIPPRLIEFPRLSLSGGVLFPIQNPYTQGWGTTTFDVLMRKLLDNINSNYQGGGGVGHIHSNLEVLERFAYYNGYMYVDDEKIKAGEADHAKKAFDIDDNSPCYNRFLRKDQDDKTDFHVYFNNGITARLKDNSATLNGVLSSAILEDGDPLADSLNTQLIEDGEPLDGELPVSFPYLKGITGSGNGEVSFHREGLEAIIWNATHSHAWSQITGRPTKLSDFKNDLTLDKVDLSSYYTKEDCNNEFATKNELSGYLKRQKFRGIGYRPTSSLAQTSLLSDADSTAFILVGGDNVSLNRVVGTTNELRIDVSIPQVDLSSYVRTDDSRLTDARPSSDVPAWAKEDDPPTYLGTELTLGKLDLICQQDYQINASDTLTHAIFQTHCLASAAYHKPHVETADRLKNERTLWGNVFDGSRNIGGDLVFDAGSNGRHLEITKSGSIKLCSPISGNWAMSVSAYGNDGKSQLGTVAGVYGSPNALSYTYYGGTFDNPFMAILGSGNIGMGTLTPSSKLDVIGTVTAGSFIVKNKSGFLKANGTVDTNTYLTSHAYRGIAYRPTAGLAQLSLLGSNDNTFLVLVGGDNVTLNKIKDTTNELKIDVDLSAYYTKKETNTTFATKDELGDYLTGITGSMVTTALGYTPPRVNNYLSGVSGNGNGTIVFSRSGLASLSFNATHTHATSQINDFPDIPNQIYIQNSDGQTGGGAVNSWGHQFKFMKSGSIDLVKYTDGASKSEALQFKVIFGNTSGTVCQGNDPRLSDARDAKNVHDWAKAATKPSYLGTELTLGSLDLTCQQNYALNSKDTLTHAIFQTHCLANSAMYTASNAVKKTGDTMRGHLYLTNAANNHSWKAAVGAADGAANCAFLQGFKSDGSISGYILVGSDFKYSNTIATYNVLHSGNFNSYALPLSGGIVKGSSRFDQGIYNMVFSTANAKYIRLCTLTVSGTYVNTPLTFTLQGRSTTSCLDHISLKLTNSNTAALHKVESFWYTGDGSYGSKLKAYKIEDSGTTFEIWLEQTQSYDSFRILNLSIPGGMNLVWSGMTSASLPTSYSSVNDCLLGKVTGAVDWDGLLNKPFGTDLTLGKLDLTCQQNYTINSKDTLTHAIFQTHCLATAAYSLADKGMKNFSLSGSGNAITGATFWGGTLTLTKGATYLTSHAYRGIAYRPTVGLAQSALLGGSNSEYLVLVGGDNVTLNKIKDTTNELRIDVSIPQVDLSGYYTIFESNDKFATKSQLSNYLTGITKAMVTTALGYTPPSADTNYYLSGVSGSGNGTITFSRSGLASLSFNSAHTHDYVPLSGGVILTGTLEVQGSGINADLFGLSAPSFMANQVRFGKSSYGIFTDNGTWIGIGAKDANTLLIGRTNWNSAISTSTQIGLQLSGYVTAAGFKVGISSGFLKANGTIDTNTYLTQHQSLADYVKTTDPRLSDARLAKDVSPWAKSATKPSYLGTELTLGNLDLNCQSDYIPRSGDTLTHAIFQTHCLANSAMYTASNAVKKTGDTMRGHLYLTNAANNHSWKAAVGAADGATNCAFLQGFKSDGSISGYILVGSDFKYSNTIATYNVLHSGNFNSYALPLSGGIVKGSSRFEQGIYNMVFSTANAKYIRLCILTVSGTYVNTPLTFTLQGRSTTSCLDHISLKLTNSNTAALHKVESFWYTGDGSYGSKLKAYKIEDSGTTFEIWLEQTQSYDSFRILNLSIPGGMNLVWSGMTSASLPTSYSSVNDCLLGKVTGAVDWDGLLNKPFGTDLTLGKLDPICQQNYTINSKDTLTHAIFQTHCLATVAYSLADRGMKDFSLSGSGNAITGATFLGGTLTLTKGATYLTSHAYRGIAYRPTVGLAQSALLGGSNSEYLVLVGGENVTLNKVKDTTNELKIDVSIPQVDLTGYYTILESNDKFATKIQLEKYVPLSGGVTLTGTLEVQGSGINADLFGLSAPSFMANTSHLGKSSYGIFTDNGTWIGIGAKDANTLLIGRTNWNSAISTSTQIGLQLFGYVTAAGFKVGSSSGFLKANGTIDTNTYLTQHQSLANYVKTTDPRLSDNRKASDVHDWAKATTKPSYLGTELTLGDLDLSCQSGYIPRSGDTLTHAIFQTHCLATSALYAVNNAVKKITVSGSGNAITGAAFLDGTLTLTKGATFLTGITKAMVTTALGYTPPSADTNYYLSNVSGSGNGTITFSRSGLASLSFNSAHTHDYVPLSGGVTLTGTLEVQGSGINADLFGLSAPSFMANTSRPGKSSYGIFTGSTWIGIGAKDANTLLIGRTNWNSAISASTQIGLQLFGYVTAAGFKVGSSSGFLKANGTIDTNTYLTQHQSLANYVSLNGVQTISSVKTFTSKLVMGRNMPVHFGNDSAYKGEIGYDYTNDIFLIASTQNKICLCCNAKSLDSFENGYKNITGGVLEITSGGINVAGNITASGTISDARLKTNLQLLSNASGLLRSLGGVYTFNYTDQAHRLNEYLPEKDYGLIYQNVKRVLPWFTSTLSNGYGCVKYEKFIPLLLASQIEQLSEVDRLKREVQRLKFEIDVLRDRINIQ